MKRVFIAINLPEEIKEKIIGEQRRIMHMIPEEIRENSVKWEKKENFHITLAFLGNTSENEIIAINKVIRETIHNFKLKAIEIKSKFIKLNSNNPKEQKIIWLEIERDKGIMVLAERIRNELKKANLFSDGKNKFYPHITLGRIRKWIWQSIDPEEMPTINDRIEVSFLAKEISLIESKLSPRGANYSEISNFILQ